MSAIIFLVFGIGFGIGLFFIDDNIVCDNKDKDDPIIKDGCEDKTKKH